MWVYYKVTERSVHTGLTIPIGNISGVFRQLRLWARPRPVITPSQPPPPAPPLPPQPMITYDKGLSSLPGDIICEIFSLLDPGALKSCSLTGKALSCSANSSSTEHDISSTGLEIPQSQGFMTTGSSSKGLPTLGEHGLLQHSRHLSIILPYVSLFAHDLDPQHSTPPYPHEPHKLRGS